MIEIVRRIEEIQEMSKLDKKSFAEKLGISAATLSHLSSGRNNPSLDLIISILETFKEVSPDWLLFGRGERNRGSNEDIVENKESANEEKESRIKLLKMLMTEHYRTEMGLLDELRKG